MKTAEELNALKEEVETLNKKLAELSEDELNQVAGGENTPYYTGKSTKTSLDDRIKRFKEKHPEVPLP